MKTFLQFKNSCFATARIILMGALLSSGMSARGQTANPLPLSGRRAGNGSVVSTQTAIPGTTTSVNTLNPAIQVQGPYAGSANSTNKLPFSGKLTLREAIERGMAYNLGAVGISQAVRQSHGESGPLLRTLTFSDIAALYAAGVDSTTCPLSLRSRLFRDRRYRRDASFGSLKTGVK